MGRDALAHLAFQAGDPHHEEFVEVVGRDRQEAHPLQQRVMLIGGLFQDAAVEVQPGQLAIDEALRAFKLKRAPDRRPGRRLAVHDRSDFLNRSNSLCAICHLKESLKDQMPSRQKWRLDDSSRPIRAVKLMQD